MAYVGWKNLHIKGARNEDAVKASIARRKYGKKAVQEAAAEGHTMEHVKPLHGNASTRDAARALAHRGGGCCPKRR